MNLLFIFSNFLTNINKSFNKIKIYFITGNKNVNKRWKRESGGFR